MKTFTVVLTDGNIDIKIEGVRARSFKRAKEIAKELLNNPLDWVIIEISSNA